MELHKLTADEIRGWDPAKRRETESEVKKALADIRMDIYTAKAQQSGKIRGLKKSLARLRTVESEIRLKALAGDGKATKAKKKG